MNSIDKSKVSIVRELLAGLTVSFVAISLGAAFGVMSERGALVGILSAGVIATITAAFGGTRIQCSGPTAPMTAVTAVIIAKIADGYLTGLADTDADQFLNMVIVLTGVMLILAAVLRLGRFIELVPKVVISGFMNGIAVLIWVGEANTLLGLGGKELLEGGMAANLAIAITTLLLCFVLPFGLRQINPRLASFLPATLISILIVSIGVFLVGAGVERVALGGSINSFADMGQLIQTQIPTQWSLELIWLALPFAGQLAMLAYLDTLLTSLVVDQKVRAMFDTGEKTAQDKELVAQGVANAAVATFGGIPGAQATIRSVLILNEGARTRIAGVMVGLFVLIEMLMFQDLIAMIPKAVFSGVLIKVGYDVFDWQPVKIYWKELRQGRVPTARQANTDGSAGVEIRAAESIEDPAVVRKSVRARVTHLNMLFILGTTLLTVLVNLNVAVISFCLLFYTLRMMMPVHDLLELAETEGVVDED